MLDRRAAPALTAACTGAVCRKHGGVWTSNPAGALRVTVRHPGDAVHYAFSTRTADFHRCSRCGVVPAVTRRIGGRLHGVVSVNAFEGVDPAPVEPAAAVTFDAETESTCLARRRRNWIGNVEFSVATGCRRAALRALSPAAAP